MRVSYHNAISQCFEQYLEVYIRSQDDNLTELIDKVGDAPFQYLYIHFSRDYHICVTLLVTTKYGIVCVTRLQSNITLIFLDTN